MIESAAANGDAWLSRLRGVVRGSTHETRNALNGLMVNLEVVRGRLERSVGMENVLPFAERAVEQAEESVRLNEAVGALLLLIVGSMDENGKLRCGPAASASSNLRFESDPATAERVLPGLNTLAKALGFGAETHDGAVILSFPQAGSTEFKTFE